MSIEEDSKEIKPLAKNKVIKGKNSESFPQEEEFEIVEKGSKLTPFSRDTALIVIIVTLIVSLAFGIGRLSALESKKGSIKIMYPESTGITETVNSNSQSGEVRGASTTNASVNEEVVASKSSTKYHFPWCSGAKRISPQNKITFHSFSEARAAGYTPAANCKGLQ